MLIAPFRATPPHPLRRATSPALRRSLSSGVISRGSKRPRDPRAPTGRDAPGARERFAEPSRARALGGRGPRCLSGASSRRGPRTGDPRPAGARRVLCASRAPLARASSWRGLDSSRGRRGLSSSPRGPSARAPRGRGAPDPLVLRPWCAEPDLGVPVAPREARAPGSGRGRAALGEDFGPGRVPRVGDEDLERRGSGGRGVTREAYRRAFRSLPAQLGQVRLLDSPVDRVAPTPTGVRLNYPETHDKRDIG